MMMIINVDDDDDHDNEDAADVNDDYKCLR